MVYHSNLLSIGNLGPGYYLNCNDATLVSRNTIESGILKILMKEKSMMKEELNNITSLTSDLWTSCTTKGYISLTMHYIDSK